MLLGALCLVLLVKIKGISIESAGDIFNYLFYSHIFINGLWVGCPECRPILS